MAAPLSATTDHGPPRPAKGGRRRAEAAGAGNGAFKRRSDMNHPPLYHWLSKAARKPPAIEARLPHPPRFASLAALAFCSQGGKNNDSAMDKERTATGALARGKTTPSDPGDTLPSESESESEYVRQIAKVKPARRAKSFAADGYFPVIRARMAA